MRLALPRTRSPTAIFPISEAQFSDRIRPGSSVLAGAGLGLAQEPRFEGRTGGSPMKGPDVVRKQGPVFLLLGLLTAIADAAPQSGSPQSPLSPSPSPSPALRPVRRPRLLPPIRIEDGKFVPKLRG